MNELLSFLEKHFDFIAVRYGHKIITEYKELFLILQTWPVEISEYMKKHMKPSYNNQ